MAQASRQEFELVDEQAAKQAARAAAQLSEYLGAHPNPMTTIHLVGDESHEFTEVVVPSVAFRLLVDILDELGNGSAVTVAPVSAELTTQQAANLLNVSRPYLIKLLDERTIPYRRVGNRRKVLFVDLMEYQRHDEALRRGIADELAAEAQNIGLDY